MITRTRSRERSPVRNDHGRFKNTCGSAIHDSSEDGMIGNYLIDLRKGKKLSKKCLESLIEAGICGISTSYICNFYISRHKNWPVDQSDQPNMSSESADDDNEDDELHAQCVEFGKFIGREGKVDVTNIYNSLRMKTWKDETAM